MIKYNFSLKAVVFVVFTLLVGSGWGFETDTNSVIKGDLKVEGNTTLEGNTNLGGASSHTTTVKGSITAGENLTVKGNTTLGDASGDTTTVKGLITAENNLTVKGDTILGDQATNGLIIKAGPIKRPECATGMASAGDMFCIDTGWRGPNDIYKAIEDCGDYRMRVCNMKDFVYACRQGTITSESGWETGAWIGEWVEDDKWLSTYSKGCETGSGNVDSSAYEATRVKNYKCCY